MRIAIAFPLAAGLLLLAPGAATAAPLVLSDHAAVTKTLAGDRAEPVAHRVYKKRRYVRKRRASWTSLPYWRPYQYRYWKFYYPYGGPLF
jgi:hypothetical protein